MGLFAEAIMAPHEGNPGAMRTALFQAIAGELISCMRLAEPTMWKDMTDVEMAEDLSIYESIGKLLQHHMEITDTFGRMYHDVANKVTPSKMDLSFFRSQVFLSLIS